MSVCAGVCACTRAHVWVVRVLMLARVCAHCLRSATRHTHTSEHTQANTQNTGVGVGRLDAREHTHTHTWSRNTQPRTYWGVGSHLYGGTPLFPPSLCLSHSLTRARRGGGRSLSYSLITHTRGRSVTLSLTQRSRWGGIGSLTQHSDSTLTLPHSTLTLGGSASLT